MMKDYRINLRLRTDIPEEAKIAEYLSTIKKSRNRFIINAITEYMEKDNRLLENIRSIFREEIRNTYSRKWFSGRKHRIICYAYKLIF